MIRHCQERLDAKGLATNLIVAPSQELDIDQEYRTMISCRIFGVGTNRDEDLEGLKRDSTLIFDFYLPGDSSKEWMAWAKDQQPTLPIQLDKPDSCTLADGNDHVLQMRTIEFNPMEQYPVRGNTH